MKLSEELRFLYFPTFVTFLFNTFKVCTTAHNMKADMLHFKFPVSRENIILIEPFYFTNETKNATPTLSPKLYTVLEK